jgi:hypothetical protein
LGTKKKKKKRERENLRILITEISSYLICRYINNGKVFILGKLIEMD